MSTSTTPTRTEIISKVEPFLDFDVTAMRHKLIDDLIIERNLHQFIEQVKSLDEGDKIMGILRLLSEIKAEVHYLKAAYFAQVRYQEPKFEINLPAPQKTIAPDVFDIDIRGDITGSNWWQAEPDGRWAGPENQSSLQFPAIGSGRYNISITILSDVDSGGADQMRVFLNHQPITVKREGTSFPCQFLAEVEVPDSYKFPFWTLRFEFEVLTDPRDKGFPDDRKLAVKMRNIRISRC